MSHDTFSHNTRHQLRQVFAAPRELMAPPDPPRRTTTIPAMRAAPQIFGVAPAPDKACSVSIVISAIFCPASSRIS